MATTNFNNDIIITETLVVSGSVGIGSTSLTGYNLRASKNITGATLAYGVFQQGAVQSDVTTAHGFHNESNTAASSFTLSNYRHFFVAQGTFGAGSSVTSQFGFAVDGSMTGATNNFGFRGAIAAGSNRWNIYMDGTADNYLAGALGIGSTNLTGINLRVSKNITGLTTAYGILQDPVIQSGVTTAAFINRSLGGTAAASFTLPNLYQFSAGQGTFGAGSTVTNQYGFYVESGLVGATNDYGFYGDIPSGANRWNLFINGTAQNFISGSLGIGNGKTVPTTTLDINGNALITGSLIISSSAAAATVQGSGSAVFAVDGTVGRLFQVDDSLTGSLFSVNTSAGLPVIEAFSNNTVRIGQYGQRVLYVSQSKVGIGKENALNGILDVSGSTTMTGSLNVSGSSANYFLGGNLGVGTDAPFTKVEILQAASGDVLTLRSQGGNSGNVGLRFSIADNTVTTNAYNKGAIYFVGNSTTNALGSLVFAINNAASSTNVSTTDEKMRLSSDGALGLGTTSLTGFNLRVSKSLTGSVSTTGIQSAGAIQSDVTSDAQYFSSAASTAAASFTVTDLAHFIANQGTFGAGSTVTKQYGFRVAGGLTGATNNYAFFSDIAAAANRWNLYMNGTANNYLAGNLGIGTTSVGSSSLTVAKTITGGTSRYGIYQAGQVQSDVTTLAIGLYNQSNTAASAFTLASYVHLLMQQGTIGATSAITDQFGVFIDSTLTGATNNYGIYSSLASGSGRWNLYFAGTANNFIAGNLGIGTTAVDTSIFRVLKNLTSTAPTAVSVGGEIQSTSTGQNNYINTSATTAAASFTVGAIRHINIQQGTFGAGSTVTDQYGIIVGASMIGAASNFAFYGDLPSGTNRWNLYMNGTANNYMAGALGIGSTSLTNVNLIYNKTITGAVTSYGIFGTSIVGADVTTAARYNGTSVSTAASAFTLTELTHYYAGQGTFGAGSTVTNQYGFYAQSSIQSATNNYGFYGNIASGTNRWNLYMNGTANNYMAGNLGIGGTTLTSTNLFVVKNITGGTNSIAIASQGTVQSDVTSQAQYFSTQAATVAATFTLSELFHYRAIQATFGAGSTVSNQYGYYVQSNLTGATNNYGFYGNLPSGSAISWNLYMNGTAPNYLAGALGIGTTGLTGNSLRVAANIVGNTTSNAQENAGTVQSTVTTAARYFNAYGNVQNTAFTLTNLFLYRADASPSFGSATVTNQFGYYVESTLTGATNNYGFYGNIASGANRWNLYMGGTAANYLAGSLGIGIASPSTPLHVNGSTSQMVRVTTSGALSSGFYDAFQILAANQTGGGLSFNIGKAESTRNLAKMVYNHVSDGSTSNRLGFGFYDADNLFNILANGNVGVGKTSPTAILDVNGNVLVTGSINATADITAFSTSDIRFKENIQYIPNALEKLDKIHGYTFDWKSDEDLVSLHNFRGHDVGVIAQEIEEVLPEVVATRDNGYKAVKYEKLTAFLIQVVKELKADNEDLRNEINNLKNK